MVEVNNENSASVQQDNNQWKAIKEWWTNRVPKSLKTFLFWTIVILIFFLFPIGLNAVIENWKVPWNYVGVGKDWLGFFSNYAGGFIGAIVALIVAGKQGKEQRELARIQNEEQRELLGKQLEEQRELVERQLEATKEENLAQFERARQAETEKEAKQRKLAQLHPLIIAQYEVDQVIFSLKIVDSLRIKNIQNIKERDNKDNPVEEEILEIKHEAERNVYNLRPINEILLSYIHLIEDMELQSKLYVKLSEYKDFCEVLAIDIKGENWNYRPNNGMDLEDALYEARQINSRRETLIVQKKEQFWHLMATGLIIQFEKLLNEINLEINEVKKIESLNKDSSPETNEVKA